jgi:putative transposase
MKLWIIESILRKETGVQEAAKMLWVSRKTIHKWKWRYTHYGAAGLIPEKPWVKVGSHTWNRVSDEIEKEVVRLSWIYKREWPQKLADRLCVEGICIDQSTVYRIMKRKNVRYHEEYVKEKKKTKLYTLETPWEELQMDTSYPYGRHRKFVIYSAIDDCTRIVYTRAYENANLENTKDFMEYILSHRKSKVSRIRTDQWREFSKTITIWLKERWIEHVKNEPYHPEHNGKIERYHRTEYEEEVRHRPYLISIQEANYMLTQYAQYYNYERKHRWLGMGWLTPYEKLKKCAWNVTLILQ